MKIFFIMNVRIPTEKAHGYQIAKMCETFANIGEKVHLVVPTRKNTISEDMFSYYGVRKNFSVQYIPSFDALSFFGGRKFGFYFQALSFIFSLRSAGISKEDVIISRNPEVIWRCKKKGAKIFYDAHNFPGRGVFLLKILLSGVSGIIANSNGTAEAFRRNGFLNVLVAPNAIDQSSFSETEVPKRSSIGLPTGKIAMYVGHLYDWKGAYVVVDAARQSTDEDMQFVFVGGTEKDIALFREKTRECKNIFFLGHHSHNEIPVFLRSSDVLLLPNVPVTKESAFYTSPIKMFEYMASGKPIVASDLPSIREVLNEHNSILVKAGDPKDLLSGILRALGEDAKKIGMRAKEDVKKYTWNARALAIKDFISKSHT